MMNRETQIARMAKLLTLKSSSKKLWQESEGYDPPKSAHNWGSVRALDRAGQDICDLAHETEHAMIEQIGFHEFDALKAEVEAMLTEPDQ